MRRHAFTLLELMTVIAIVGILMAILFPVFAQAREAARKSTCQENLTQIGIALQLYARDNDGRLPAKFNDFTPLAGRYLPDEAVLHCPSDPTDATAISERARNPNLPLTFGYQYRGGLSIEDRADIPVAAEWDFWHADGANVLFLSGSVKYYRGLNWIPVSSGPRPFPAGLPQKTAIRMRFTNDPPGQPPTLPPPASNLE